MSDPVPLALKLEKVFLEDESDEKTKRRSLDFVWFKYRGKDFNWGGMIMANRTIGKRSEKSARK